MPRISKAHAETIAVYQRNEADYKQLYWYVSMTLPLRSGGGSGAPLINGKVQVVPVAPCPETSFEWAELLRCIFEDANRGKGLTFSVALTDAEQMTKAGYDWCKYGDEPILVDRVCLQCGAIHRVPEKQSWVCCVGKTDGYADFIGEEIR